MQSGKLVGIDVGGTKISLAVFDESGRILMEKDDKVGSRGGYAVFEAIKNLLVTVLNENKVSAIGICVPGVYTKSTGKVWAPNIKEWTDFPLKDEIQAVVGDTQINIVIESDRSCYILGEAWKGAAKGCSDALFIAVGTGIGAGIISNNQIISGAHGIAGAIGWLTLDPNWKKGYESFGNYEFHASGDGLARTASELLLRDDQPSMLRHSTGEISSYQVFEAFKKGDKVAEEVISLGIDYWGRSTANLVSILNPEKVIFGGGMFGPADKFINRIYEVALKWGQPLSMSKVKFEVSELEGRAGLIGAGYLAKRTLN